MRKRIRIFFVYLGLFGLFLKTRILDDIDILLYCKTFVSLISYCNLACSENFGDCRRVRVQVDYNDANFGMVGAELLF